MQEILQGEQEIVELLPGAVLEIASMDSGSSFSVVPVYLGSGVNYSPFYSGPGGRGLVGPFTEPAMVRVSAVGRVSVSKHAPNGIRRDATTGHAISAGFLALPYVLGFQNTDSGVTGTVAETVLWEMTIPARMVGLNDLLVCHPLLTNNNNANNKTMRVRFGPAVQALSARAVLWSVVSTTTITAGPHVALRMRNSRTAGILEQPTFTTTGATRGYGQSSNPAATVVVDTDVDSVLSVTGQLANVADSVTLNSVIAKLERMGG